MKTLLAAIIAPVALPLCFFAWAVHMTSLIIVTKRRHRALAASQLGWG